MARLIDALIGHQKIWQSLLAQMQTGHLPHAMAFAGPAGIGKVRVAWAFAQALVCEAADRPCGTCPSCRRVENQQSESVLSIEPQGGTIKLEGAHQILQFLNLQRLGRARVVIVDAAQNMNPQAANTLLKIIEEPPPETFFILVVSELSQLLPTIRSRVQVLRFSPLSESEIQGDKSLPAWMVRSARGSFAQLETFQGGEAEELRGLAIEFIESALQGRREGLDALLDRTKDREAALSTIHFLQQLLRDWSVVESSQVIHADLLARLKALKPVSESQRMVLWQQAFQLEKDFVAHVDRALLFENFYYRARNAQ